MDEKIEISLDKLPIKRLESIEENGFERFPSDVGYDEKRLSLIRRIDFAWAVEKDEEKKKQKKASNDNSSKPLPWQNMVESLQLAHQELSVIIDLINTVEANDIVTVAGMTRPKPLPNEVLSDLAVSSATKLQCFRHLGKYFKQSSKALEEQISREARFYGALIRLQQNWKVKRQRLAVSSPSNQGFTIDLYDNALYDSTLVLRPSSSTVRVDHDSAGMLAIQLPSNSCHSLSFGILGSDSDVKTHSVAEKRTKKESTSDEDRVKETHMTLREVHQAIFHEQVFELINREAFKPSLGVNITGIKENYLQLNTGQGASVFISLVPSCQDDQIKDDVSTHNKETDVKRHALKNKSVFPNHVSFGIYLQQIFHENAFVKAKDRVISMGKLQPSGQPVKEVSGFLGHFCLSLAHRIFSNKVLEKLEKLVCGVPYLHLVSHPTWYSRASSWTLLVKVPQSTLHLGKNHLHNMKNMAKIQFCTKVVLNDNCITVEGEGAPNVAGLFKGSSEDICSMNRYDCDLAHLPVILLQQVGSQVIRWLHEEALMMGIKATRDFLSLSFEVDEGERLSLVAHVDPEDIQGCISWWFVMEDMFTKHRKFSTDLPLDESDNRKFLGHLSLDVLYSTLLDLVNLCNGGGAAHH